MNFASRIVSTGHGIPSRLVTNEDLSKIVETNDEWIRSRTGIRERHFLDSDNGQYITDVAKEAAEKVILKSGVSRDEIDLVVFASISQETPMPNNASRMLGHLGLKNAAAFDINAACGGFIMGLHTVDALIRAGSHKKVLLFAGDALSAALDMKDRSTCVLFGDGAGCALVERIENPDRSKDSMILGSKIYSIFDSEMNLAIKGGNSRAPAWKPELHKEYPPFIQMNGQEVFKYAVKGMMRAATELLTEQKVTTQQIKWFVPHQANLRIIEMTAKMLDFPMDKVFVNIDRWANTSAATVIIALSEMEEKGLLAKGDLVLMDVFGGGFNYGAALVRW